MTGDAIPSNVLAAAPAVSVPVAGPARPLSDLPRDELNALAEEFGLQPAKYKTAQVLVTALHERRQLVAVMDREAMLDVVRWGRRPVPFNAGNEQVAQEIVRCRSMKFAGLSHRGLVVLAHLRGVKLAAGDDVPTVIKKLRKREGLFARLHRLRRGWVGSLIARLVGDDRPTQEYMFLPPAAGPAGGPTTTAPPPRGAANLRDEIEETGLFGGLANRVKRSADGYLNQKLDEIESRIDRKLDEIDRRLGEWRDKEIANRIRILKITLWASVIVAAVSLVYAYVKAYLPQLLGR